MISTGWSTYKIGNFIEINPKVTLKRGEKYSFVEMKDLDSSKKYALPSTLKLFGSGSKFQNGDILFARITPCLENGKICMVKDLNNNQGFGSTEFIILRGKEKVSDNDYVYYLSRTTNLREAAIQSMTGTSGRQRVDKIGFENIEVLAPENLSEQYRIASILSSLDDKIELNLQMNKTLEAIARAIFKEWFVDFRFPGFDDELVAGLPKGWRKDEFINHIIAERGLSYKGNGLTVDGDGIPMNNLNSVYEGGGYKYEGIKYYNGEYKERHVARPGDIIIANTEQGHKYLLIGYPAVVPGYYGKTTIYSHHIYRVRPKSESNLTSQFIYYLLLQPNIRDQVVGCCNGTTVNMLKVDGLQRPVFILPPMELIKKFSELVQGIWQRKETNFIANQTLTQIRNTLLPKLMTGKIRVA